VPFHFWTPDVYQGSPTPFTGYMAAVAKAAGFAGLLRVLTQGLLSQESNWRPAIWLIAVLTLLVGSALAIAQKDLKRMLAYSSISQAGYVLVGVQAASSSGTSGAVFYLFTYTFIVIGTFAVIGLIQGRGEARNDLGAIRGLARRQPWLATAMLVLLLAQAGVPFTTGFLAKLEVVSAAVGAGSNALAVVAMVTAAIAAFFYLRVVFLMYSGPAAELTAAPADQVSGDVPRPTGALLFSSGDAAAMAAPAAVIVGQGAEAGQPIPSGATVAISLCVVVTVLFGLWPGPLTGFAHLARLIIP
jgi:NADH-quinone oxidoreductase subunit N